MARLRSEPVNILPWEALLYHAGRFDQRHRYSPGIHTLVGSSHSPFTVFSILPALPEHLHREPGEHLVSGKERHALHYGLGRQDPVEGIAV